MATQTAHIGALITNPTSAALSDAREYRRLSDDRGGNSIQEQADGNKEAADGQSWNLGAPYVDADRSASSFATRKRDDFERLISDLETGNFGARILMLWESSRGSRKVSEWARLIDLCRAVHVMIWVTTHGRLYDMEKWSDRKVLLGEAIENEGESERISVRGRRTAASQAKLGRPHGLAPYGLMPTYDPKTGKLDNWIEDEAISIVPKELFRLLEKGYSLRAIERLFLKRGYLNGPRPYVKYKEGKEPKERPFTRHNLRNMATRHAYAGVRVHTDPESGKTEEIQGTWDWIVSPERFYNVQRIINAPGRNPAESREPKYELTMTLKCDPCGGPITVTRANLKSHRESYTCRDGHVFIAKADVDAIVIPAMLGYLARPDVYEMLTARKADDENVRKVRADLAQARANREEMEKATPESLSEARVLARSIEALADKIAGLEEQERGLTLPPVLASLLGAAESVEESWEKAPISARREIAKIILTPQLFGEARILRAPRDVFDPVPASERIDWRRVA
ncbi:recombinase family protein [Streptomyces rhizosphaericus]|uniref:Recombinase family protein n=1 Tax=Streptomyces rhizosphaericus TaxID=114699 RepID=A0A6G4AS66_9ACTN|nr:recombinase family protein [Streptomyces rhizosphaericus]NEW76243.1 recombinase family protein [Streptomyces rhizosphaericus]